MKAKEYAKRLIESENKMGELGKIIIDFLKEVKKIKEMRNVSTDAGVIPILKEQNQKFRSFAGIANSKLIGEMQIDPNGFMITLETEMPIVYEAFMKKECLLYVRQITAH